MHPKSLYIGHPLGPLFKAFKWLTCFGLILATGCTGLPKYSGALLEEEHWRAYDHELQSLQRSSSIHEKKIVPFEEKTGNAYIFAICSGNPQLESSDCEIKLKIFLNDYFSETSHETLAAIPKRLIGLSYQATTCLHTGWKSVSPIVSLATQLGLGLPVSEIENARKASLDRIRSAHGISSIIPNTSSAEENQSQLRVKAQFAADELKRASMLLAQLSEQLWQCSARRLRQQVATELHSTLGFAGAQTPTAAISYSILEASRQVPPAYQAEFQQLAKTHSIVLNRTIKRYSIGQAIVDWQNNESGATQDLEVVLAELIDLFYSEASNSDRIAGLLNRAHWAHIYQLANGSPDVQILANGARALSTEVLLTTKTKNQCVASSLYLLAKSSILLRKEMNVQAIEAEVFKLIGQAKRYRESLQDCKIPDTYVPCTKIAGSSREYFRLATSSITISIEKNVIDFENNISTTAPSDINIRRNIMAAQFISGLQLLLRSVDANSSCSSSLKESL